MTTQFRIRPAEEDDLPAIQAIYAFYVKSSSATFELTSPDIDTLRERMRKIKKFSNAYLVAEEARKIIGYAYAGEYRLREGYLNTVESSVYLSPHMIGRGIGRTLLNTLIDLCRDRGFAEMVAVIGGGAENQRSIHMHKAIGFRQVGTLKRVGYKFDRWLDTCIMQYTLSRS